MIDMELTGNAKFDGELAPLDGVVRFHGSRADAKRVKMAHPEDAWIDYWNGLEDRITRFVTDECGLLDELRVDIYVAQPPGAKPYFQATIIKNRDLIAPIDKPKETPWHLN